MFKDIVQTLPENETPSAIPVTGIVAKPSLLFAIFIHSMFSLSARFSETIINGVLAALILLLNRFSLAILTQNLTLAQSGSKPGTIVMASPTKLITGFIVHHLSQACQAIQTRALFVRALAMLIFTWALQPVRVTVSLIF